MKLGPHPVSAYPIIEVRVTPTTRCRAGALAHIEAKPCATLGIGAGAATGPASDRPRRGSTMNSRTSTASAIPGSPTVIIATRQP